MSKVGQAVSCFREGLSCSQAVLSTYSEQFGLNREMALKVSGAFGGGVGRMGEICGAMTGALMVIGLKHGRTEVDDEHAKEKRYGLVKEFIEIFQSRCGSIFCRELLGCDISTPEGSKFAQEQRLSATLCPTFVRDASEIIERLLGLG